MTKLLMLKGLPASGKSTYARKLVAEKDYIDAKAAAESAQAELARARRHLDVLGLNGQATTDRIPLFPPCSGVVLTVSAAPGELSKSLDNADPLLTIADLSTVWIVGDVFEKDVAEVQPGTKATVTVDAFPGEVWAGRIDSVSGALDPARHPRHRSVRQRYRFRATPRAACLEPADLSQRPLHCS